MFDWLLIFWFGLTNPMCSADTLEEVQTCSANNEITAFSGGGGADPETGSGDKGKGN